VNTVLEIGPGPGVVAHYLTGAGLSVCTVDIDPRLEPDAVASALALPFREDSFDAVLCCEVLEHLPFSDACEGLAEIKRVASFGALISVPNQQAVHSISAQLPLGNFRLSWPVPWRRPEEHRFDGEHHWELGTVGFPVARFRSAVEAAGWSIDAEHRSHENPYHHFFFLR
jgi:hypothetical protein